MDKNVTQAHVVSFCVIAYNEESTLPSLLNDLIEQTYPKEMIEVILVDSGSEDHTRQIMETFSAHHHGYRRVLMCDNKKRTQPCGWNVAIAAAQGDVILRIDAHAGLTSTFIEKNVVRIASGASVCGGYRPNVVDETTPWKSTLLMAEASMFGSSIAPYRRNVEAHVVNSVFHGAYRKEVFERVGGFNEDLTRTEDNEMHYRIRKAGYKICFDPEIISYQHTRSSFSKMLRQKYLNGFWIGRTAWICPACLELYHFVPLAFVLAIMVTAVLAVTGYFTPAILLWSAYGVSALLMSIVAIVKDKHFQPTAIALPFLFLLLHLGYGIGTVFGITCVRRLNPHI